MKQSDNDAGLGRRDMLKSFAVGALGVASAGAADTAQAQSSSRAPATCPSDWPTWRAGIEGQRRADLGNGRFLNPIMPGDHPDPTILKDGEDYYMTFSSFDYYPGIIIWHSRDLVNWTPIGPALKKWIGPVYALDLVKHEGRYYIYIPALGFYIQPNGQMGMRPGVPPLTVYVIHADNIHGPWSDPINLNIPGIDPGHAVGEDGKRYLFINDGRRVRLTDDGLATDGQLQHVYDGWRYPEDWVVEGFALEGPKMLRKDGWFYMFSAVGGTAGPPTSHMVIVARARSIDGPWENCPHNPIVRTQSIDERWWSRGHATPVEDPHGDWWMVYHGYENGYRTLGRQVLLDPIEWDRDGWPRARGGDLARALTKPRGAPSAEAGQPLSDDFSRDTLGTQLAVYNPKPDYLDHIRFGADGLVVHGSGTTVSDCSPLALIPSDHSYEVSVEVEISGEGEAGLLLFYAPPYFAGLGVNAVGPTFYNRGAPPLGLGGRGPSLGRHFHLRVINDRNVASFFHSLDGATWTLYNSAEVSGYNHNVANGFLGLRPAIYMAGAGEARFRNLRYAAR
jgi:xylan 1,4-beta-xylosidase